MNAWVFGVLLVLLSGSSLATAAGNIPAVSIGKPLSAGVSQEAVGLSDDIQFAEALVKQKPQDAEAYFLLAVAYSRTPYLERALEALDRSRRLAQKSPEGFALFDRKIAEYEKMRLKTPDDSRILYRLGFGYYIRGYAVANGYMKDSTIGPNAFYDQAEQTFQALVALDATDYSARNYLGYLLAEREPEKNYEAAVALWQDSLRINPENPGAYMLLGQAALQKGNLKQALQYSSKALHARNAWLKSKGIDPDTVKVRL
ncbi:tetratricopeptide repeat protein [Vampirovibrio sp.]|uniref:tetratricopeptide repeat protein n=1 Tax=Vampirovibrio sp. TaxID=2717857 RepID=UPI003594758F